MTTSDKDGATPSASSPITRSSRARSAPAAETLADVRFLTVAEVAGVMRVSKMTVYRIVHSGELPAVRVGRSFRVPEQAVHDYLRAAFIDAG
jgi:excisionase family DNA binding protein